jgi:hypothetical protein
MWTLAWLSRRRPGNAQICAPRLVLAAIALAMNRPQAPERAPSICVRSPRILGAAFSTPYLRPLHNVARARQARQRILKTPERTGVREDFQDFLTTHHVLAVVVQRSLLIGRLVMLMNESADVNGRASFERCSPQTSAVRPMQPIRSSSVRCSCFLVCVRFPIRAKTDVRWIRARLDCADSNPGPKTAEWKV